MNIDVRRALRRSFGWYLRGVHRAALPRLVDVDHEQRRLNILRIYVGLVALVRTVLIVYAARFYFVDPTTGALPTPFVFWSTVELGLLGMFTLGICTPLATLGLVATYLTVFEPLMRSFTLGTLILQSIWICFLFANVGARFSVDEWVRQRTGSFSRVLRGLYRIVGFPSADTLTVLYSFVFLNFALLSLAAVLFHLDDPFWLGGHTVGVMLQDSYFNPHFEIFRTAADAAPVPWRMFSVTGVVFQTLFQLFMIPLIFLQLGRRFVIWWGLNFVIVSLLFLSSRIYRSSSWRFGQCCFSRAPRSKSRNPRRRQSRCYTRVTWHGGFSSAFFSCCKRLCLAWVASRTMSASLGGVRGSSCVTTAWSHPTCLIEPTYRCRNTVSPILYRYSDSGEPELVPFNGPRRH